MNIQAIKDELSQFIQTEFHEDDWNILSQLADIFVSQHGPLTTSGAVVSRDVRNPDENRIRTSAYLNLDTVMEFMERKTDRGRMYTTILKNVHSTVVATTTPKKRGGGPCQITFKTFEGFVQACLCLRGPKAKYVSLFAAKCTSIVVELFVAIRANLRKTTAELQAEKAEVWRRVYLVIKDSVAEARREMGRRYTDFKWRQTHYCTIVSRLLGSVYVKGKTPYVRKENMRTAKESIKKYYKDCIRRDVQKKKDTMIQTTIDNVQTVPTSYNKTSTTRCPIYVTMERSPLVAM